MKNPKIRPLVDDSGESPKRKPAAIPRKIPASFAEGKFTVQVASYPTETDARERVESLKKLGFPYAYFSAKELGDKPTPWYRVWLGYYPDYDSARLSGEILQERGEVKNYLVRRTDTSS
jgi:cell division septation protein DedD